jgi:hypothetical protein
LGKVRPPAKTSWGVDAVSDGIVNIFPPAAGPEINERFALNKRVLMLTAATTALLSGHAYAASPCNTTTSTVGNCDITTAIAVPLYTGTAATGVTNAQGGLGNITLDTDSSLTIGTNPPTAPALTINSSNTVTNATTISYQGVNDAVGVLLEEASVPTAATGAGSVGTAENWTGEYYSSTGNINLLGAGSGKFGILIAGGAFTGTSGTTNAATGVYANQGLGVFTGSTGFEPVGGTGPVAIDVAPGSLIEVQGTNSAGINLIGPTFSVPAPPLPQVEVPSGGGTLIGDIDIGGSIQMTPVTVGSTTGGAENIAINIAGFLPSTATPTNPALAGTPYAGTAYAMVGNINVLTGGSVSSEGQGAEGVVLLGELNGAIINAGSISTEGTTSQPSTALSAADPEGGAALLISNSVTGGIFNSGPTQGTPTSTASISMLGNAETIGIAPTGLVQLPITIGGFTDSAGYTYSLLNRGSITAQTEDANLSTAAIKIAGNASAVVSIPDGIFNSGAISAETVTNADGTTIDSDLTVTALSIGDYATIGTTGNGGTLGNGQFALVNSNETNSGIISANISGAESGTAIAVLVQGGGAGISGSLPSIYNSGRISATAFTTNLLLAPDPGTTGSGIAAIAIDDQSGTLTNIYNTGIISATATVLDDNSQVAIAIDVANNATKPVTVSDVATTGSAVINGDIQFGTQPATLIITGVTTTDNALVNGNLTFNNATTMDDTITIGQHAELSGEIFQPGHSVVDITINNTGFLNLLTSQPTNINSTVSVAPAPNTPLKVGKLDVEQGGNLTISLSQGNNVNAFSLSNNVTVISGGPTSDVSIDGDGITPTLSLTFGSFVGTPPANGSTVQFVLIGVDPAGKFTISPEELGLLVDTYDSSLNSAISSTPGGIPFLFNSTICTYNVTGASGNQVCSGTALYDTPAEQELVLTLTPKSPSASVTNGGLGLTGYALKMFPFVNQALVNDNSLGAAMVTDITNSPTAQAAYAAFAPDVSGATRATAISLTDSASNVVAARQRELRMYANQEGDTTLWGQQFGERLSQGNTNNLTGYNDSGFGFVLGIDDGDQADGRYGGAFTFFSGGMSQKEPTSAKTASEYYIFTGYTDWRGKGLFIDTQLSAGYGTLQGHRYLTLTSQDGTTTFNREADGNRPTELLAGSVATGGIFTAGGTVFMPQLDVDALTSREEAYTENGGGEGFNLRVQPYYANSLRAFLGADIRQDVNFGDFYLQPELRAGYRYDFVDGATKLKANFASVDTLNGQAINQFTIEGPDPGRGNVVLGGGVATTTGAWSIGVNYDYVRGGNGPTEQTGIITLLGRI